MYLAPDVLSLRPEDLGLPLPLWEPGVAAGQCTIAVIEGSAADWESVTAAAAAELRAAPVITLGVVRDCGPAPAALDACDLVVGVDQPRAELDGELERLVRQLNRAGAPALVAAQVLRAGDSGTVALESLAYSVLLWSEDFSAWREAHERHEPADTGGQRVSLERGDAAWRLTLTRPAKHNAFDAQMREQLCDALDAIASEPSMPIVLLGEGPSFCSGGDLDEFGTAASPVAAHLVRCGRSVARRLQRLGDRLVAGVHGGCIGAGLEFAAFARTVIAASTTTFLLPELTLGLNLGAGGTISIPRRIGRQATLRLLLDREPMDAARALQLGLVDEVVAPEELERRCRAAAEKVR